MMDGTQFFPVGGHFSSSSVYNDKESDTAFKAVKMLDATFVSDFWQNKLTHKLKVDEDHFDQNG